MLTPLSLYLAWFLGIRLARNKYLFSWTITFSHFLTLDFYGAPRQFLNSICKNHCLHWSFRFGEKPKFFLPQMFYLNLPFWISLCVCGFIHSFFFFFLITSAIHKGHFDFGILTSKALAFTPCLLLSAASCFNTIGQQFLFFCSVAIIVLLSFLRLDIFGMVIFTSALTEFVLMIFLRFFIISRIVTYTLSKSYFFLIKWVPWPPLLKKTTLKLRHNKYLRTTWWISRLCTNKY